MSRSIKDLRELINISRLSYHGDEGEFLSDEEDKKDELRLGKLEVKPVPRLNSPPDKNPSASSSAKSQWTSRFKPLPAINSFNKCKTFTENSAKVDYEKSCNAVLQCIDPDVVGSWLVRANKSIEWLSRCISTECFFVKLAHFWLSEIGRVKQRELVDMEVEIVLDEITFAVQNGIQHGQVIGEDVLSFFQVVLWEYPLKLHGIHCQLFLLNTLLILASGKKDEYRYLLSNVKFKTRNLDHVHWILAVRSFALITIVAAIVNFYSTFKGHSVGMNSSTDRERLVNMKEQFAFHAVKLGYVDVLDYLLCYQNVDISQVKNKNNLSLLFVAVTNGQEEVSNYILQRCASVDIKQVSSSGNGLLHAAVNSGMPSLVKSLLDAGADVNQVNTECNGATPLHLAVMQGKSDVVQILLDAGGDIHAVVDCPTAISPLKLAQELELSEIVRKMTGISII